MTDSVINAAPDVHGDMFYATRDLYEAAVLHVTEHAVINLRRGSDGICYFIFDNKEECEHIVNDYRNKLLKVNAKLFIESLKTMKDFIFGAERRG